LARRSTGQLLDVIPRALGSLGIGGAKVVPFAFCAPDDPAEDTIVTRQAIAAGRLADRLRDRGVKGRN
jgi:hypothetical protein